MYNLAALDVLWKPTRDPLALRAFLGSPDLGWKVAWSDRMVWMYIGIWVFALLWWPLRQRVRPLSGWGLVLFLLPLAVDGSTHLVSDMIAGIGGVFRYNNMWLAILTNWRWPTAFYAGDAIGSFNFFARMLSGVMFSLGVTWFIGPRLLQETGAKATKEMLQ